MNSIAEIVRWVSMAVWLVCAIAMVVIFVRHRRFMRRWRAEMQQLDKSSDEAINEIRGFSQEMQQLAAFGDYARGVIARTDVSDVDVVDGLREAARSRGLLKGTLQ